MNLYYITVCIGVNNKLLVLVHALVPGCNVNRMAIAIVWIALGSFVFAR